MDPISIVGGLLILIGVFVGALLKGVSPVAFFTVPAAFMIVVLPTFGAAFLGTTTDDAKKLPKLFRMMFRKGDGEAGWSGHRSRKAIHGYKAHVAADRDSCLVDDLEVTPGNAHEGRAGMTVIPENPGEVFADSAYRGAGFAQAVRARGGVARVCRDPLPGPRR